MNRKQVHVNDLKLAIGQTGWNIGPTCFRGRNTKYAYYSTDIEERKSTNDTSMTTELSITSTDSENPWLN